MSLRFCILVLLLLTGLGHAQIQVQLTEDGFPLEEEVEVLLCMDSCSSIVSTTLTSDGTAVFNGLSPENFEGAQFSFGLYGHYVLDGEVQSGIETYTLSLPKRTEVCVTEHDGSIIGGEIQFVKTATSRPVYTSSLDATGCATTFLDGSDYKASYVYRGQIFSQPLILHAINQFVLPPLIQVHLVENGLPLEEKIEVLMCLDVCSSIVATAWSSDGTATFVGQSPESLEGAQFSFGLYGQYVLDGEVLSGVDTYTLGFSDRTEVCVTGHDGSIKNGEVQFVEAATSQVIYVSSLNPLGCTTTFVDNFNLRADYFYLNQTFSQPLTLHITNPFILPEPIQVRVHDTGGLIAWSQPLKIEVLELDGTNSGLFITEQLSSSSHQFILTDSQRIFRTHIAGKDYTEESQTAPSTVVIDVPDPVDVYLSGQVVEGLHIRIYDTSGYLGYTVPTDASGRARFREEAGTYRFRASYMGKEFFSDWTSVPQSDTATIFLIDEITEANVQICGVFAQDEQIEVHDENGVKLNYSQLTDSGGVASFLLDEGVYQFRLKRHGYDWFSEPVSAGSSVALTLPCDTFVHISGPEIPEEEAIKAYTLEDIYTGLVGYVGVENTASFSLPDGEYKFRLTHNGREYFSESAGSGDTTEIHVPQPTFVKLHHPLGLDSDQKIEAHYSDGAKVNYSRQTNEEGLAEFHLVPDEYKFRHTIHGRNFYSALGFSETTHEIFIPDPLRVEVLYRGEAVGDNYPIQARKTNSDPHGPVNLTGSDSTAQIYMPEGDWYFTLDWEGNLYASELASTFQTEELLHIELEESISAVTVQIPVQELPQGSTLSYGIVSDSLLHTVQVSDVQVFPWKFPCKDSEQYSVRLDTSIGWSELVTSCEGSLSFRSSKKILFVDFAGAGARTNEVELCVQGDHAPYRCFGFEQGQSVQMFSGNYSGFLRTEHIEVPVSGFEVTDSQEVFIEAPVFHRLLVMQNGKSLEGFEFQAPQAEFQALQWKTNELGEVLLPRMNPYPGQLVSSEGSLEFSTQEFSKIWFLESLEDQGQSTDPGLTALPDSSGWLAESTGELRFVAYIHPEEFVRIVPEIYGLGIEGDFGKTGITLSLESNQDFEGNIRILQSNPLELFGEKTVVYETSFSFEEGVQDVSIKPLILDSGGTKYLDPGVYHLEIRPSNESLFYFSRVVSPLNHRVFGFPVGLVLGY